MSRADFAKVHVIPTRAQQLLQREQSHLRGCGICPTSSHCWIASGDELLIWNYSQAADVRSKILRLPGDRYQELHVQIIAYPPSTAISVLACTANGTVYCWLDATYLSKPQVVQLFNASNEPGKAVTSFTAARVGQGANQAYLALAGTSDEAGAVYILQGSRNGNFVKQLPTNKDGAGGTNGVVGMLGSALKFAYQGYAEFMNPEYKARRRGPSNQPVINCIVVPHELNKWKAYLLTYATIDCWLITMGDKSNEELLWSFNLLPVVQGHLKNQQVDILNFDISSTSHTAYIWSAHKPADSGGVKYALHTLPLDNQGVPWPLNTHVIDDEEVEKIVVNDDGNLSRWTVVADGVRGRCLLMFPQGPLAEWDATTSSVKVISQDAENLAIAARPSQRTSGGSTQGYGMSTSSQDGMAPWMLLSAAYGLLELASPHDTPQRRARTQEFMTTEMEQAALAALNSALMGKVAVGLRRRLESLGVFEQPHNVQLLAQFSSTLLNKLPKHWSATGAEVTAVEGSMVTTLKAKQETHDWYIYCLAKESCLTLVHDLSPAILRTIFENAEKLAATSSVAQLVWPSNDGELPDAEGGQPRPVLLQIAEQAGQIIKSSSESGLGLGNGWLAERSKQLGNWEVTFSYAAAAPEALFQSIEQLASEARQSLQEDMDVPSVLEQLRCAADVLDEIALGADAARTAIQRVYALEQQVRTSTESQDWLHGPRCRSALEACTTVCRLLKRYTTSAADAAERVALMQHFTEKLLNAYAAAVSSTLLGVDEAPVEALVEQYQDACDVCLSSLLEDALLQVQDGQQEEALGETGLVWVVEALSAAHFAHKQLFQLCETLSSIDPDTFGQKLLHHMRASGHRPGGTPQDTFSRYVFEQLYRTGQWARLLELPPTYWPELKEYLGLHTQLLHALLVQMGDFPAAAATMLEEGCLAKDPKVRRRMLCLSRMACRAAGNVNPADPSIKQKAAAQLQLLDVQRALGLEQGPAMAALVLAEAALQPAEEGEEEGMDSGPGKRGRLGVLALRALLAAGPGSKEDARLLWRAAWEAVVEGTDWQEMEAARKTGDNWQALCESSPLFQAVSCCNHSHLLGFGSEVIDLGELQEVSGWIKEWSQDQPIKEKELLETFEYGLEYQAA